MIPTTIGRKLEQHYSDTGNKERYQLQRESNERVNQIAHKKFLKKTARRESYTFLFALGVVVGILSLVALKFFADAEG